MTDFALPVPASRDTPRTAYRVLERRATLATLGLLFALAGLAWWHTVGQSSDMSMMVQGFAHVGTAMPFDMSAPAFIGMWTAMMVAMMFPTVAPIVLLHRLVIRRRQQTQWMTAVFGLGYIVIWAIVGLVPLGVLVGFRHISDGSTWVLRAGGAVLVIAGIYQFTRWKDVCQRACRSPLTFLATHNFGRGALGTFRTGVSHGLYCFGCCWALMAVLFVVGLMNLTWMAAITAVFLAEKNWKYGANLTKFVGAGVIVFGLVVIGHPSLLDSVAPMTTRPMTGM